MKQHTVNQMEEKIVKVNWVIKSIVREHYVALGDANCLKWNREKWFYNLTLLFIAPYALRRHYLLIVCPCAIFVGKNCFPQQRQTQINPRQINVTIAWPIVLHPIPIGKWKMINLISIFIGPRYDSCHQRCRPLKTYSYEIKRFGRGQCTAHKFYDSLAS